MNEIDGTEQGHGPDRLSVAVLQMCSQDRVGENLAQAELLLEEAFREGAHLVVLPEGCFFLGTEQEKTTVAEEFSCDASEGPMAGALSTWAKRWSLWILAGGVPERNAESQRPFNTSLLVSPAGHFEARYRKMHLFDVALGDGTSWHESQGTSAGEEPVVAQVEGVDVGLSICYDLRFPELYAWQKQHGARILTVPAAFTRTTGEAHWQVLLRARAIENQCFVLAAAQEGTHPQGRRTFGHASIVDPWGRVLAERTRPGPGVVRAEIELAQLNDVRARMPVDRHRARFFGGPFDAKSSSRQK